jgi:hypothetical protein
MMNKKRQAQRNTKRAINCVGFEVVTAIAILGYNAV